MNRIEFMTSLKDLLLDLPEEERVEAIQFYNNYFDDAGPENEAKVIEELGSPAKVAAVIKASGENHGEFTENGYTDSRFDQREVPAGREQMNGTQPKTNPVLKVLLIIAVIVIGGPIIIPIAIAVLATIFGIAVAAFAVFVACVILAVSLAFVGIVLLVYGFIALIPDFVIGITLIGIGLVVGVIGLVGTVLSVKLCIVVFPAMFNGIVNICRKPFHRKAVN